MKPRGKYAGTAKRRQEIIKAALKCFSREGVAGTTMADVRRVSKASHGSIYHHFQSKEQLAAAVYLEGIAQYQSGMLNALEGEKSAKEGINALVRQHLSWVRENPDWARYLFQMRHAAFMKESESELSRQNKDWANRLVPWFVKHIQAGAIRKMPKELYVAILFGPCQELTRLWLAGQVTGEVDSLAEEIGEAAWKALRQI